MSGKLTARVRAVLERASGSRQTTDNVIEQLRDSYPEYSRMKKRPLLQQVERAMQKVRVDVAAAAPLAAATPSSASSTAGGDAASSATEGATKARATPVNHNMLNRSLASAYGRGQSAPASSSKDGKSSKAKKRLKSRKADRNGQRQKRARVEAGGGADVDAAVENAIKRHAANAMSHVVERPTTRYADLAGIEACMQDVRELIEYPLTHPEIYTHLGVAPPRGILLHGPPGCGKSMLANAIAGELGGNGPGEAGVTFLRVSAPEVVSGMSGESEKQMRALFDQAVQAAPAILFLDEIDAIAPKRGGNARGMERRIVAQLLTCLDGLSVDASQESPVMVIAATNRPHDLDPALRRAGRFDREICLGVPTTAARSRILRAITAKMRLTRTEETGTETGTCAVADAGVDFDDLAQRTPGFVGADLAALAKEAAVIAVNRAFSSLVASAATTSAQTNGTEAAEAAEEVVEADGADMKLAAEESAMSSVMDMDVTLGDAMDVDSTSATATTTTTANGVATENGVGTSVSVSVAASRGESRADVDATTDARAAVADGLRAMAKLSAAQMEHLTITRQDFEAALKLVQPSAKREGFATVPGVTWADVGALSAVRDELVLSVLQPIRHPERFTTLGITMPAGVLLYGPPGCGKTLLAKAIANESGANFISVKGPELLDKYVGESERAVRRTFERARTSSPCIIFFDELDALAPRRGGSGGGSGVSERVVNQLLTELDGLDARRNVFVIAATNRPDMIDPAMLRPGRLDKLLYVPLPAATDRVDILRTLTRKTPLDTDISLSALGADPRCTNFSGADLSALVREAAIAALRESFERVPAIGAGEAPGTPVAAVTVSVAKRHFTAAFAKVLPSVSASDLRRYDALKSNLRRSAQQRVGSRNGGAVTPPPPPTAAGGEESGSGGGARR